MLSLRPPTAVEVPVGGFFKASLAASRYKHTILERCPTVTDKAGG
jgi:hypothetical protein